MKKRLAAALGLAAVAVLLGADPASAAELGRYGRFVIGH